MGRQSQQVHSRASSPHEMPIRMHAEAYADAYELLPSAVRDASVACCAWEVAEGAGIAVAHAHAFRRCDKRSALGFTHKLTGNVHRSDTRSPRGQQLQLIDFLATGELLRLGSCN